MLLFSIDTSVSPKHSANNLKLKPEKTEHFLINNKRNYTIHFV